jgi:hypothetical protein
MIDTVIKAEPFYFKKKIEAPLQDFEKGDSMRYF